MYMCMCVYLSKKKRKRTKKASKVKNVHHKKQQHCESVLGAIRMKLCRTEWRQEDNERDRGQISIKGKVSQQVELNLKGL